MSRTKVEHVNRAYQWLVISGITTQPTPEEISLGVEMLEDMMNELKSRNVCSSYIFEDIPDPNTDSGIDPAYNNAASSNLAVRLANFFGKEAPPTLSKQATQSMSNWAARTSKTNAINPPRRQPRGSGNTFRFSNWVRYYRFENNAPISCDTFELKVGEVDFFSVDFSGYLLDGSSISGYTLEPTNNIQVLNDSLSGNAITLECKGIDAGAASVLITITTTAGRTNPETVNFNITSA